MFDGGRVHWESPLGAGPVFAVRPEQTSLNTADYVAPEGSSARVGQLRSITYLGATTQYVVETDVGAMTVQRPSASDDHRAGDSVVISWPSAALFALPGAQGDSGVQS